MSLVTVAAFYRFFAFPDFAGHRAPLQTLASEAGVQGTILLAEEGVNGTIAGPASGVEAVIAYLRGLPGCAGLTGKRSYTETMPFYRMKVRLKKEIVTLGVGDLDPEASHERYVAPERWNDVIADPDVLVIDTRNDYEVSIGSFEGAINPHTKSFRDFPEWFREFRLGRDVTKVAMFCTGGIRCEKSTAFLRREGLEDVVHLQGGILNYLETVPEEESLWRGECFVFDHRVSVRHDLAPGDYDMCHACRQPISQAEKNSPFYQIGVSCPACHNTHSPEQKRAFAERQRQMELAEARGESHIGARPSAPIEPEVAE